MKHEFFEWLFVVDQLVRFPFMELRGEVLGKFGIGFLVLNFFACEEGF